MAVDTLKPDEWETVLKWVMVLWDENQNDRHYSSVLHAHARELERKIRALKT
jgi:hypothetical protein